MDDQVSSDFAELVTAQLEMFHQRLDALTTVQPASCWPAPTADLAEWVDGWLAPTFDMGVDVRDWQDIPALVSELTALWIGYRAMTDPRAGGFDALLWHSYLASARNRMREYSRYARHRKTPSASNPAQHQPRNRRTCAHNT